MTKKNSPHDPRDPRAPETPSLQPTAVILLLAISIVIVMIVAFIYLYVSSDKTEEEPFEDLAVPPPHGAIVVDPDQSGDVFEFGTDSAEGDSQDGERGSGTGNSGGEYDSDFFTDTLFIGDSVFTGIDGYGFTPSDNVFAEVGINAADAITAEIKGRTLFGESGIAKRFNRAVIMIGTNGLYGTNAPKVADDVYEMALKLKSQQPAIDVIILTVPPVCEENEYDMTSDIINEFNGALTSRGQENGDITVLDFSSLLSDGDGYLAAEYAQPDGVHLTRAGYEVMFGMLQSAAQN